MGAVAGGGKGIRRAMGAAFRAVLRAYAAPAPFLTWAALTGLMAISGPFGTYDSCTFVVRLQCFGTLVGIGMLWGVGWRALVQHAFPTLGFWGASALVVAVSAAVLPVPLTGLASVLTRLPADRVPSFAEVAGMILAFGAVAAIVRRTMAQDAAAGTTDAAPRSTAALGLAPAGPAQLTPRLLRRIDPGLVAPVLRLTARDHYVDVVTARGSATILMRLTDAIDELDGVPGMRVHRSHWVADAAVHGAEVQGDRIRLVLTDGARVPVARPMLPEAEARGLIRDLPAGTLAQRGMGSGRAAGPVSTATASGPNSDESAGSELIKPPV